MEIREIKVKTCLINDFNAMKIISISKVNEAQANSSQSMENSARD